MIPLFGIRQAKWLGLAALVGCVAASAVCAGRAAAAPKKATDCNESPRVYDMGIVPPTVGEEVSFRIRWHISGQYWNVRTQYDGVYVAFQMHFSEYSKDTGDYAAEITTIGYRYRAGDGYSLSFEVSDGCSVTTQSQNWLNPPDNLGGCSDVQVFDLHGLDSRAGQISLPGDRFVTTLRNLWPTRRIDMQTSMFDAEGGPPVLFGAATKLPLAYYNSVERAKDSLRQQLDDIASQCPSTRVFLVGYSQGAQVVGDVYQEQARPDVVGVALFGDPYYNHSDSSDRFGLNIKPKQRIKTKLDGALAAPKPRKAFNSKQVMAFCHQEDPVCQAPLSSFELAHFGTGQHKNYDQFGEPEAAAKYFSGRG